MKRIRLLAAERRVLRQLEETRRCSGPCLSIRGLTILLNEGAKPGRELSERQVDELCSSMVERELLIRVEPLSDVQASELGLRSMR